MTRSFIPRLSSTLHRSIFFRFQVWKKKEGHVRHEHLEYSYCTVT